MYRAYLRTFDGRVTEKTNTPDRGAAAAAFADLISRTDLDGQRMAAALTYQSRQIAFHRFDRSSGDLDYWRGRLHEIEWPASRGGVRAGAGAKAADGATDLQRYQVTLDAAADEGARALGDGDRSLGLRRAVALALAAKG